MYLVVFNLGHDGDARGGGEFTLIRVSINWGRGEGGGDNWFLQVGKPN